MALVECLKAANVEEGCLNLAFGEDREYMV